VDEAAHETHDGIGLVWRVFELIIKQKIPGRGTTGKNVESVQSLGVRVELIKGCNAEPHELPS
jgi:hypothetical protein